MSNIYKLEVETQRLKADVESLRAEVRNLRDKGKDMMEGINALSAMWEGEAKNAFTEQFRIDYNGLLEMAKTLDELIRCLEDARQKYDTCEDAVGSIVAAIRV